MVKDFDISSITGFSVVQKKSKQILLYSQTKSKLFKNFKCLAKVYILYLFKCKLLLFKCHLTLTLLLQAKLMFSLKHIYFINLITASAFSLYKSPSRMKLEVATAQ